MIKGLNISHDEFKLALFPTITISDASAEPESIDGTAQVFTRWTPNSSSFVEGIKLSFQGSLNEALTPPDDQNYSYHLEIPELSYDRTEQFTGSYGDGTNSKVIMREPRVRTIIVAGLPAWELTFTEIEWFINGSSIEVIAGGTITNTVWTPAGIPLIGYPATVSAGAGEMGIYANWASLTAIEDTNLTVACSTSGSGWCWVDGGIDVAFPVMVDRMDDMQCPLAGTSRASISAGATNNASVSARFSKVSNIVDYGQVPCSECPEGYVLFSAGYYEPDGVFVREEHYGSEVTLIPAVERSFVRLGPEYGSLAFRWGYPAVDAITNIRCEVYSRTNSCEITDPPIITTNVDTERYFNPQNYFLGAMGAISLGTGVESPLAGVARAPYAETANTIEFKTFLAESPVAGLCIEEPQIPPVFFASVDCCYEGDHYRNEARFGSGFAANGMVTFPLPNYAQYLLHDSDVVNYFNFHCNPHWCYWLYFAIDCEAEGWVIEDSETYHIPIRSQYIHHPSLPVPSPRTRNHIVTEPLDKGQLAAFADIVMGLPTSFLGISRFEVIDASPDAERTYDGDCEDLWSLTNCTGVFGSTSVDLTSSGPTSISAKVKVQNFEKAPFNYGEIAKSIELDWDPTNIDSISVYLENQDGGSILLGTSADTYDKPITEEDAVYAGSWAQDFGLGATSDTGVDTEANGVSVGTMADPALAHAYELFGGQTATYIRYDIELTSAGSPCTINYPIYHKSTDKPHVVQETGQFAAVVIPNGPLIRFGQHNHWDSGGVMLVDTPALRPPGELATEPDGLAFVDHYCKGDTAGTTATPWEADEYDDDADRVVGTHAFLLPMAFDATLSRAEQIAIRVAVVNSLRECPPLVIDPRKKRAATFAESGDYGLWAYTFCQNVHKLTSAKQPMKLYEVSSGMEWTGAVTTIPSWFFTDLKHAVQMTEAPADFEIRVGEDVFANVTPWHGYSAVLVPGVKGEGLAITRDDLNNHYIAFTDVDGLKVRATNFRTRDDTGMVTSSLDAGNPGICWLTKECCIVLYDDGTDLFASFNYSRGNHGKWSGTPLTIVVDASNGEPLTDPVTGMTWFGYWKGTDFEIIRADNLQDILDLNFDGPYTIATAPEGKIGLAFGGSSERWLVAVFTNSLGDQEALFSYDQGETWG